MQNMFAVVNYTLEQFIIYRLLRRRIASRLCRSVVLVKPARCWRCISGWQDHGTISSL